MSLAAALTREDLANAAADVAGQERPLTSRTPKSARVYFYATPDDEGGSFGVSQLSDRLQRSGMPVGVDWDRESETFGLRFVLKVDRLPAELLPFSGPEARREWSRWRGREKAMSAHLLEAARVARDGGEIVFDRDMEPGDVTSLRNSAQRPRSSERE